MEFTSKNNRTYLKIIHNVCGAVSEIRQDVLKNIPCCNTCNEKSDLKTEGFKKRVYSLVGDEYMVLGKYHDIYTKIKIKHNCEKCGNFEYDVIPNNFVNNNRRCPKCAGRIFSFEEVKQEILTKSNYEIELISQHTNKKEAMLFKCNKCDNTFYDTYWNISRRFEKMCPICSNTFDLIEDKNVCNNLKNKIFELHKEEYEILEYHGLYSNAKVIHKSCKNVLNITPIKLLKGYKCSKCYKKPIKPHGKFLEEIQSLYGDEFEILETYQGVYHRIKVKHNNCNNIWKAVPHDLLQGYLCPYCKSSKGERRIYNYLKKHNLLFEVQYKFQNCRDKQPLRFDFAIFNDELKTNVKLLIEYDGEQHYKWIENLYTKKEFATTQFHDKIKNEYCKSNGIQLIRIPYWELDNIEKILSNIINQ